MPAQLKTKSRVLKWRMVEATQEATWEALLTSVVWAWVEAGRREVRAVRAGVLVSQMERWAPREASLRAVARLGGRVRSGRVGEVRCLEGEGGWAYSPDAACCSCDEDYFVLEFLGHREGWNSSGIEIFQVGRRVGIADGLRVTIAQR